MGALKIIVKRLLAFRNLLLLGTVVVFAAAIAQTQKEPDKGRIVIDGAQDPDRIPEWVLWYEVFRMAALQSEKSPTKGEELWVDKLHLSKDAMNEVIRLGFENRDLHALAETEAKQIVSNGPKDKSNKEKVKSKLRKIQGFTEARTLEIRDKLRARIGEDAFLRLESYARLQITPRIQIGN